MCLQSPDEIELNRLKKTYAQLTSRNSTILGQIEGTLNDDDKRTLDNSRQPILSQMRTVWNELEECRKSSPSSNRQCLNFQEDLPKIDFQEAIDEITDLIRLIRQGDRGDVLMVIQNSLSLSGDLFLQRVRDEFKFSTTESNFTFRELGFHSDGQLNEYDWLERLAKHLGITVTSVQPEQLANTVIEKICQSTKSGSVLFLEIHKWDELPSQEQALTWFVDKFWIPLVSKLDDRQKYRRVKFVAVIVVDSELNPSCFETPCLCSSVPFRLIKPLLRDWTIAEIQSWIEDYAQVQPPRSDTLSQRIFRASRNGMPPLVRAALEREFLLNLHR
jgi:inactive STAND